jgi:cobalt-precorrin 5A hydrolase
MKCALIAVSDAGASLAARLEAALPDAKAFVFSPHAAPGQETFERVPVITEKLWSEYEGLVFLCASGIAVRAIAPLVHSKYKDPAVVVTADNGAFAISLLSGHEGGANGLASEIAALIGAVPVITTASEESPRQIPRNLIAGIGCRRGTTAETLQNMLNEVFSARRLSPLRLRNIATIDLKRDEKGLLEFAESIGVPLSFFSAEELNNAEGDFEGSDFVLETTGTDNVCERSAALSASGDGRIIVPKTAANGITIAIFEKNTKEAVWLN